MKIYNRKFRRDYQEIEKCEAGIALTGAEVKSIRMGRIRLEEAFVKIMTSGVHLVNAEIPIYQYARPQGYDSRRSRKLLLHKEELTRLKTKINSGRGLTIVPVSCYNRGHLIKLQIALVKGRREIERKKLEKKRDMQREEEKEMKEFLKK